MLTMKEERRNRAIKRLIELHTKEIKRWTPEQCRDFLLSIGSIDESGQLTEEFGGEKVWGGLGK